MFCYILWAAENLLCDLNNVEAVEIMFSSFTNEI